MSARRRGGERAPGALPVIAVVGRPNVGKSSLVNRLIGRREAIVEETPGVTRDRRSFAASWRGRSFELVDTGGLEPGPRGLDARVAEQAHVALETADVVVLVVDVASGPTQDDLFVAELLRASSKPVLVAVNKVDDQRDEASVAAFYRLGLGDPIGVSALHGRASGDLLDALLARLPQETGADPSDAWASIAIIGRPNVGKSSLLNALVGEQRAIVDAVPGTTRDPVDAEIDLDDDRRMRVLDTAGMRRRVQIEDPIEYFGWLRSRRTIERADAVLLAVDAAEGVSGVDQRIAEEVVEQGRACTIVLNKWDLVTTDPVERRRVDHALERKLRFLPWAPVVRTSALTGRGIDKLIPAVSSSVESHRRRLPTPEVNRVILSAQQERPHPRAHGRAARIRYAVQADIGPPTFVLFTSAPLQSSYLRFVERKIREREPFEGSPLRIVVRVKRRDDRRVAGEARL